MKHFKRCLLLFLTLTFLTACQAVPMFALPTDIDAIYQQLIVS